MDVEHHHRLADLVAVAATLCDVEWDPSQPVYLERTGARLEADAPIAETGLVSGDVLRFELYGVAPPARTALRHAVSCDVTAGPEVGRSFVLQPGRNAVGRAAGPGVVLDDPTVAEHQLSIDVDDELATTLVPGPGAVNPVLVNGKALGAARRVGASDVVQFGATAVALRVFSRTSDEARDQLGQVPFRRTPNRPVLLRARPFPALGAVPTRPEPARLSLLVTLLPLVGGLALFALRQSPVFLLMTGMSPVLAGANWWQGRRAGGERFREQVAAYRARVERRRAEVDEAVRAERAERIARAPDLADLARRATLRTLDLWPRQRGDEEFGRVRLGLGPVASLVTVAPETTGEEYLREATAAALAGFETLPASPVCVNLTELGVFGLHGQVADVRGVCASIVLQAATLHSPEDLVLVVIEGAGRGLGSWAKWLPHTRSTTSPVAGRHVVESPEATAEMLRELVAVARRRLGAADRGDHRWPWVLVMLDDGAGADPALVSQLLELCPAAGISVVAATSSEARVPRQARATMRCESPFGGARSLVWFTDPDAAAQELEHEPANARLVDQVAMSLAPLRDATAANATSAIPRVVPLFSLFDGNVPTAPSVAAAWATPRRYGLRAPIGVGPAGPLELDLVEHGPHALIGGTSGAGKSELLQSIVASLISRYPPSRLTFLFVDYKGGAASVVFQDVPHTVGYVTNLDASLARRALTSLRAELNHRMRLLEGKAKDLAEMLERHPDEAPPSLVIVVDEFATLVKEVPDFVAGVVDVAQRGRSLGIHLILATQRPSGAVNDNILANTNLRISLRMLDPAESTAVIGDRVAADIPVPLKGRGFARLGPRDLVEFQSAFTGSAVADEANVSPVTGELFGTMARSLTTTSGRTRPRPATTAPGARPAATAGLPAPVALHRPTHLAVLLGAVRAAWAGRPLPRRPWCEMLPEQLAWSDVEQPAAGRVERGRLVTVGRLDDPAEQAQFPAVFDLEEGGGLVIAGGGGSGKTTALRTIAVAATADATAAEVTLFVIDCSSRSLGLLRDLPHCAEVATGDDVEAVTRVIVLLAAELDRRRRILADFATQAESLSAYLAAGHEMARVVVLVDGYQNLHAMLASIPAVAFGPLDWLGELHRLITDGRQVGIHVVVTVDRRQAIPPLLMSSIGHRLVLRQTDDQAYAEYGIPLTTSRGLELPAGRGLWNEHLVQVAVVGDDASAAGQAAAIGALVRARGTPPGDGIPPELRTRRVPEVLTVAPEPSRPDRVVIGCSDVFGDPVEVSIGHAGLTVAGPPRSGRTTALCQVARSGRAAGRAAWTIGLGADGVTPGDPGAGRHASARVDDVVTLLDELANLVEMARPAEPVVLVVDNADRLEVTPALTSAFERLVKSDAVRLVGAIEARNLTGFSQNPVLNELRRQPAVLVLQPDTATEAYHQTGVRVQLRPGLKPTPGRGVLVADRQSVRVQVGADE